MASAEVDLTGVAKFFINFESVSTSHCISSDTTTRFKMKKYLPTILQLTVFIGLPASFIATAFHSPSVHLAGKGIFGTNLEVFLLPFIFTTVVMSVATIIVHHLRDEQRLNHFNNLYLRKTPTAADLPAAKPRLVTAKA